MDAIPVSRYSTDGGQMEEHGNRANALSATFLLGERGFRTGRD